MDDSKFKKLIALKSWAAWEIFSDPELLPHARKVFEDKVRNYNNGSESLEHLKQAEWIIRKIERMSRLDCVSTGDMLRSQREKKAIMKEIVRNGLGLADMCVIWRRSGRSSYPESLRESLAVRNSIIEDFKPFAFKLLRNVVGAEAASNPDLISAAFEGLIRGVDLYDPARKVKFASYAAMWIRKAIYAEIRAQMEVPERYALVFSAIRNSLDDGALDENALMELTGLPESTVKAAMEIYRAKAGGMMSIDATGASEKDDRGRSLHEYIEDTRSPSPEEFVAEKEMCEVIQTCIQNLPPKEREVLEARLGGASLQETAGKLGMSASGACRAEQRAIRRIRSAIGL